MKKKFAILAIFTLSFYLIACGNGSNESVSNVGLDEESKQVTDQTSDEALDDSSDQQKENQVEEQIENQDTEQMEEQTDNQTTEEFTYNLADYNMYKNYFLSNIDEYGVFNSQSNGPIYEASFALIDLNKDGHLDYVISGALGLRCAMLSEVFLWNDEGLDAMGYMGEAVYVGDNLLWFDSPDYEDAGAITYDETFALQFDGTDLKTICHSSESAQYYDLETGEELAEEIILREDYFINDEAVSKGQYKEMEKTSKAECKEIEWTPLTKESVEAYFAQ